MGENSQAESLSVPSWLDKCFVQKALRSGDNNPSLVVISCDVSMANSIGDGYSSDMYRIVAKLEDSQERRVVVKCFPQEPGPREELMKKSKVFDSETRMLTGTLPAMHKLLNKGRPGEFEPFSATCLYHGSDPVQHLVLEDLRQSGFTLAKREYGLDVEHCTLVVRTLARFHAASVALHEQHPEAIECYNNFLFCDDTLEEMTKFVNKGAKHFCEAVSNWPGFEKLASKLKKLEGKFRGKIADACVRKDNEFNVLIHGDLWTNNMMFKYSGNVLESMRLVDFQLPYYASPALDLLYFLYSCPNDETRTDHLDDLVKEYHSTLDGTLKLLGAHQTVTLSKIKEALNYHLFYGFYSATSLMPLVLAKPDDGFDFESTQSDKGDAVYRKLYSNEDYVKAVQRLLPFFEEMGLLG